MGSEATDYKLGKLNGRRVITWREGLKRPRYRLRKGISLEDAQRELSKFVKNREILFARELKAVAEIVDLYIKDRKKNGKPTDKQEFSWKALKPFFGHLCPDDIDKDLCDAYRDHRLALGRKEGTIWTELSVLRAALNWGVKAKKLKQAPFIWLNEQPPPKERHLTREEADKFNLELKMPHLKLFVQLALGTAARAGALFELRWDKIDWNRRQIDLRAAGAETNKRRAIVPINDTLLAALQEAQKAALTGYVVEWAGDRVRTVKGAFKRAAERAGLEDVTPHTLRHTAAVWMAEAGIAMSVISQYLGHSSTKVTERVYARYSPTFLREAAAALELQSAPKGSAQRFVEPGEAKNMASVGQA